MLVVRNYIVDDQEYMVLDGTAGFMPGSEAVRLLTNRRIGVGADRVLVFTGTDSVPSFVAYSPEGEQQELTAADYRVLSYTKPDYEIHITDCFIRRLKAADHTDIAAVG